MAMQYLISIWPRSSVQAPSSPVMIAAVKDTMKAGLLDFRQSLRESVGARLGIRKAMKNRFSAFLSGKHRALRVGGSASRREGEVGS